MTHDSTFLWLDRKLVQIVCGRPSIARWSLNIAFLLSISACGIDTQTVAPALAPDQVLVRLRFEAPVYNLATAAPYDTVQLRAVGYSGTGTVVEAPVEFSVALAAESKLSIDSTGMLRAIADGKALIVRARMTYHGSTATDSAFVYVVAGAPPRFPSRMRFELAAGDSAKLAHRVSLGNRVRLHREDSFGDSIPDVVVKVWSADSTVLRISNGFDLFGDTEKNDVLNFTGGGRPGITMIHASAYAYGVWLRDSLAFRIGWPLQGNINIWVQTLPKSLSEVLAFGPASVVIGVGGCVVWQNTRSSVGMIDMVFDDPSDVAPPSDITAGCSRHGEGEAAALGGNIAPFVQLRDENGRVVPLSHIRTRTFPKPGIYTYRSMLWGTTGTIVVCDEHNDPTCAPEAFAWFFPAPLT